MAGNTAPFVASGSATVSTLATTSTLGYSLTAPYTTYTNLGNLTSLGFSGSVGEVDSTNLASLQKNYLPGLPEATVSATVQVAGADTTFVELNTLYTTPAVVGWEILLKDGSKYTFTGFVTGLDISGVEPEGVPTCDVDIRVTGAVTYTAPTS